jgi:hypothetical protein
VMTPSPRLPFVIRSLWRSSRPTEW